MKHKGKGGPCEAEAPNAPAFKKAELRKQVLHARDQLLLEERRQASLALLRHIDVIGPVSGCVVASFWPIKSEIDPQPLARQLREGGAKLALPVVIDKTTIEFRQYFSDDDLIDAGFGTKGPPPAAPLVKPDIMLVPLSVFDVTGGRIGYGAGFYDRAIARLRQKGKNPRTVGLAFSMQQVERVPQDEHDVALDCIITPDGAFFPPEGDPA